MKNTMKKLLAWTLSIVIFISPVAVLNASAAGQSTGNTVLPKVTLQKKPAISIGRITKYDKSGKTTAAVLKLAQKYYNLAYPKIESGLTADYAKNSLGKPRFDGKFQDLKLAVSMSSIAGIAILSKKSANYAAALACNAFSKGTKQNLTAQNMGTAVYGLFYAKDAKFNAASKKNAASMSDIVTIYQYAVSLNPKNVDTLVCLGNVFMDMDRQEDAKILYQEALRLQKGYKPAHEGMAAYYLARGDWKRAQKELENKNLMIVSAKVRQDGEKKLTDPKTAPDIKYGDSAEKSEAAIKTLSKLPLVSMADFIDGIDPVDAQQIRLKINHMPQNDKLTLPKLTTIAQISEYKAYMNDTDSFREIEMATDEYFTKWQSSLEKLMEKYMSSADGVQDGTATGDLYSLKGNCDNRLAEYMFTYNTTVLNKKATAYLNYFGQKVLVNKYQDLIDTKREAALKEIESLDKQEEDRLSQIDPNLPYEVADAQTKKIQAEYALQRNEKRQGCFQANFGMMVQLYQTTCKPMVERYWADCMPHVRLMPEGKTRDLAYYSIAYTALGMARDFIFVMLDSAHVDGIYEDVTGQDLEEAGEELREAYRQQAEQEFQKANLPVGFSQQALLDKLSYEHSLGPVSMKINLDSIELSGGKLINGKIKYDWGKNNVSGELGVGVDEEIKIGAVSAKGELSTTITATIDLNTGKVTDLDWKGKGGVSATATGKDSNGTEWNTKAGISYETSVMQGNKFSAGLSEAYGLNFEAIGN